MRCSCKIAPGPGVGQADRDRQIGTNQKARPAAGSAAIGNLNPAGRALVDLGELDGSVTATLSENVADPVQPNGSAGTLDDYATGLVARGGAVLQRSHEWILLFCKETHILAGDDALCDLTREEHQAWLATEWHVRCETRTAIRDHHCAPFPEEIAHRLIKLLTYRRDLVIDPMCRSGTTTAVAASFGRRLVGIDRSAKYAAFARMRTTAAMVAQPDVAAADAV